MSRILNATHSDYATQWIKSFSICLSDFVSIYNLHEFDSRHNVNKNQFNPEQCNALTRQ